MNNFPKDIKELLSSLIGNYGYFNNSFNSILNNPNSNLGDFRISLETLSRIGNDPHVSSCVQSRKAGTLSKEWDFSKATSNNPERAEAVNNLIDDILSNLDLKRIISEILEAPYLGFKPLEIYWGYSNGYLKPLDIKGRPAWWFQYDSNELLYFNEQNSFKPKLVPKHKVLIAHHIGNNYSTYGEAIFKKIYSNVQFKHGGVELWARALEKYGIPYVKAIIDRNIKEDEIDSTVDMISKQTAGGVYAMDSRANLEIQPVDIDSTMYNTWIHFHNAEISKAILSQTLTTEQGDTGSYAMSQTHLQVRDDVIESDSRMVEKCFNTLISYILELNFPPGSVMPPVFSLVKPDDWKLQLAQRDQILLNQINFTEKYYGRYYNLKEDEFSIKQQQSSFMPASFAESDNDFNSSAKDFVNNIVQNIVNGNSTTYDELLQKIVSQYPDLDTSEIEELLADVIAINHLEAYLKG